MRTREMRGGFEAKGVGDWAAEVMGCKSKWALPCVVTSKPLVSHKRTSLHDKG
jgi:hypothetical protein